MAEQTTDSNGSDFSRFDHIANFAAHGAYEWMTGSELLYDAVRNDQWNVASDLIRRHAFPDEKTLKHVVLWLESDWVEKLLDAGAKPTPEIFHLAVSYYRNKKIAELLAKAGGKSRWRTRRHARRHLNVDLKNLQADFDGASSGDREPLYKAVLRGEFEKAKELAAHTVPDAKTLHLAIRQLDSRWVRMLLDAGAEPTSDALYEAVSSLKGKWAVTDVLTAAGAVPDERTMRYAVMCKGSLWVQKLIDAGGRTTSGMYDIAFADVGNWAVLDVLPAGGGVPDEKTVIEAINGWVPDVAKKLIDACDRPTPDMLHLAVKRSSWSKTKFLIDRGVVPAQKTLDYARDHLDADWNSMLAKAAAEKPVKTNEPKIMLRKPAQQQRNTL